VNLSSSVDSIALRVTSRSKPINGRLRGRNVRSIAASDSSTVVGPFPKIEPRKQASGMAREMTGPSSLSARAPSIFVGANRPTAVCAITLGGRRTFRVSPNRSAFVRSFGRFPGERNHPGGFRRRRIRCTRVPPNRRILKRDETKRWGRPSSREEREISGLPWERKKKDCVTTKKYRFRTFGEIFIFLSLP